MGWREAALFAALPDVCTTGASSSRSSHQDSQVRWDPGPAASDPDLNPASRLEDLFAACPIDLARRRWHRPGQRRAASATGRATSSCTQDAAAALFTSPSMVDDACRTWSEPQHRISDAYQDPHPMEGRRLPPSPFSREAESISRFARTPPSTAPPGTTSAQQVPNMAWRPSTPSEHAEQPSPWITVRQDAAAAMNREDAAAEDRLNRDEPPRHGRLLSSHSTAGAGAAMEIDSATAAMDSVSIEAIDAGVGAYLEHPGTPRAKSSSSIAETSDTSNTNCKEQLKTVVGMIFDTLADVEKFYKSYAHDAGFSVRIGQHKKKHEEILFKRYYCSREGYSQENVTNASDESGKKRKSPILMETRCGCPAHIVVKLDSEKKYQIVSMVEEHSHGF
ncbi:hypothetical protein ACP70R_003751 [Stipagrostis hirtigluma subsp. patula]